MEDNSVTQKPTPQADDAGGASTLDRLERYLAAQDAPDDTNQDEPQGGPDEGAENEPVKPDGDATGEEQPQITTSDLAKFLGVDEAMLDLDEDGTVKFKTKIDGEEGAAKFADFIKTYQIRGHAENEAREVSKQREALQAKAKEAEAQFTQRLQYAENLTNVAAQQLLQEFQSIDWKALEQQDPGTAALWRQKFQERHAQLQGVHHSIQREKQQTAEKSQAELHESLAKEAKRLPELIPEWKDEAVARKERAELRDWAIKAGYEPAEIDSISKAHHVAVLRKAMLADRLQSHKAEVENKVRLAPKLVKPGQPAQNSQAQTVQNLKTAVRKSGGKGGSVAAYLLATGKV